MLQVVETFVSINGEGTRAGELSYFIRFHGCNLQCSYCDTRWANEKDTPFLEITADELCRKALEAGVKNVTLTGGEPLLQKDLPKLTALLIQNGLRTEIETNGSLPLNELAQAALRPVFTMDYKLPGSGMQTAMNTNNFSLLEHQDTVKFVIGDQNDLVCAEAVLTQYHLCEHCHVYFRPVFGRISPAEIVDFMKEKKLAMVRLQLQLHKIIWDPDKRGV